MWQSNFKEEGMRAFVAYLLALGLVAAPAMAATGSAGDKDKDNTAAKSSSTAATDNSTATEKKKDVSAERSKPKPGPHGRDGRGAESTPPPSRSFLCSGSRQSRSESCRWFRAGSQVRRLLHRN